MASRTMALFVTAAIAAVVVSALLPATARADEDEEGQGSEGPSDEGQSIDGVYYIKVGDAKEWNLGVDYSEWVKYETFNVGDVLRFVYSTDQPNPHNVVWVDQASYNSCTVPSNGSVTMATGNDVFQLQNSGLYYFISGLNGDCLSGMRLAINVA